MRQLSRKSGSSNYRRRSMRSFRQKGGDLITLRLFDHLDQEYTVKIAQDATVLQLKAKIAEDKNIKNITDIQLFFNSELRDDKTLSHYRIADNAELSLVVSDEDEMEEIDEDDDDDDEDEDDD